MPSPTYPEKPCTSRTPATQPYPIGNTLSRNGNEGLSPPVHALYYYDYSMIETYKNNSQGKIRGRVALRWPQTHWPRFASDQENEEFSEPE